MSYAGLSNLRPIKPERLLQEIEEEKMWTDIRKLAKTSPALQDALDRAIEIYILTKPNG